MASAGQRRQRGNPASAGGASETGRCRAWHGNQLVGERDVKFLFGQCAGNGRVSDAASSGFWILQTLPRQGTDQAMGNLAGHRLTNKNIVKEAGATHETT